MKCPEYWESWCMAKCPQCQAKNWIFTGSIDYDDFEQKSDVIQCFSCKSKWLMNDMENDHTFQEIFWHVGPNEEYKTISEFVSAETMPTRGLETPE